MRTTDAQGATLTGRARTPTLAEKHALATTMRQHPTRAEARVGQWLKTHPRLCGLGWWPQVILRGYIVDFYCPRHRIVLEVDGSIHARPDVAARDQTRNLALAGAGYTVLHVTNGVTCGALLRLLFGATPRQKPDRRQLRPPRSGWVLSPADKALKVRRALDAAGLGSDVPRDAEVTTRRRFRLRERRDAP